MGKKVKQKKMPTRKGQCCLLITCDMSHTVQKKLQQTCGPPCDSPLFSPAWVVL